MKDLGLKIWSFAKKFNSLVCAAVLTVLTFLACNLNSASFFKQPVDDELAKRNELLVNVLLLGASFLFWRWVFWLVKNYKKYKKQIWQGVIYFAILMMFLFLTWPGVWRNDDMGIALSAKKYEIMGWQHVLTSLFYMVSYKILPFFSGVIVVQCALISIITAYLFDKVSNALKVERWWGKILLAIPFFLPPVLDSTLYPMRSILFSYALILLIYVMCDIWKKKEISKLRLVGLIVLTILVGSWRSEGIYMLAIVVIFLICLWRKKILNLDVVIIAGLALVVGVGGVNALQKTALCIRDQQRYEVTGTIETVVPLVRAAYDESGNDNILTKIDKVLDVNRILQDRDLSGEKLFWMGVMRINVSDEDFRGYKEGVVELVLKHPKEAIKNRLREFCITSGFRQDDYNTIGGAVDYYENKENNVRYADFVEEGGDLMRPWNLQLRNAVIEVLEGREVGDYRKTTVWYPIFWNLVLPILGIMVFIVYMISHKKMMTAFVVGSILIKTAIVFVTAPEAFHIYYFAEYLLGYILWAIMIYLGGGRLWRGRKRVMTRMRQAMMAIGNCLKLNWGWILAGVLLWGWGVMSLPGCFNLDNLVYSGAKARLILMLCALAVVIVAGLMGVRKIMGGIWRRERFAKRFVRFSVIALIINGAFLLLIWPGNWINDEFWILHSMANLEYNSWQNYLTVLWYAVGTMLFHSAVGIVVMQTIFISLAFAYFLACLDERIGEKNIIYLLFLVLLIPPIFCNDFYPLRITMYAYGELWLLCFLYRQYKVRNKIKWSTAICLGVVIFLLAYWRSEGIYYMILPLILFLFFGRGKDLGRKCLVMFGVSAVFFVGFTMMDKLMSADMYYQYKTTAFINPLSTMLTHDEVLENSKEEIAVIDEVMDVGKLREEAEYWNILVYLENTDSLYRDGYQEKIGATSGAFIKIVFKNVGYFLENRLRVFGIANGDYDDTTYWRSLNGLTSLEGEEVRSELANYVGGKPWWGELRVGILRLMRGDVWGWVRVFWNVIPVAIGVLALFAILLVKRKWFAVVLVFSLMMRFVLVFLTAPASLFMYYFPTFLEGGLFVIAAIIIWFDSVSIQKKRRRLSKTDA